MLEPDHKLRRDVVNSGYLAAYRLEKERKEKKQIAFDIIVEILEKIKERPQSKDDHDSLICPFCIKIL